MAVSYRKGFGLGIWGGVEGTRIILGRGWCEMVVGMGKATLKSWVWGWFVELVWRWVFSLLMW